ncbi:MAG TPA: low molecular weight protein-tyrosine-phosphatase [Longimicrobiales bacterium]|nr:low molecular weight protein-tyrosine-phosphatase [Longimicrobiales bacterium]
MPSTPQGPRPTTVLFVCLGNICRSPLAEGIFLDLVEREGLQEHFVVDSAGTGAWHVGERPDRRSVQVAEAHGVSLPGRARQVTREDLARFDRVVAMDRDNIEALRHLAPSGEGGARIHLLREYDPSGDGDEVPDPYYGGNDGFEVVYQMIRRSCQRLLDELRPVGA